MNIPSRSLIWTIAVLLLAAPGLVQAAATRPTFDHLTTGFELTGQHRILACDSCHVDAVFKDHEYLAGLGKYEHMWGVGRHLLGSQVYDYWCDPWGRVHERWADTDRLNARSGTNLLSAQEALVSQWGEDPPERFIRHVTA